MIDVLPHRLSKYNHGFTENGYLHSAILKDLYNSKLKRVHKAKDQPQEITNSSFKMFIMRFLGFSKCLKTTLESTEKLATGKAEPHSWYSYFVTNVGHYCTVIIEGIYNSLSWSHLKLTVQIQLAFYPCDLFFQR